MVTTRSRGTTTIRYREKEEHELDADIEDSEGSNLSDDEPDAPEWLQDDVDTDADVELDSADELDKKDDSWAMVNYRARNKAVDHSSHEDSDEEDDEIDSSTVSLKIKKLNEVVKQSQVYSSIIADTLLKRTTELSQNVNADDSRNGDENGEPPKKKSRSILDFFRRKKTPPTQEILVSDHGQDDKKIKQEQPSMLQNCILKPYQMEGLNWLITLYENGLNGILADEMGLGKTVQSIAMLSFIYEMDTKGPFLIAAPLSTIDNWVNEFNNFAPGIPVLKYYHHRGAKERTKLLRSFFRQTQNTGVVITSYEMIMRDSDYIVSQTWKFLIVDEGHRLKNINSKLLRELKRINTTNRLLLTGTPLQNSLAELWSLLNFILPDVFADFEIFNKWFDFKDTDLQSNSKKLNKLINDELEKNLISNLHTILKPFLLRRLKRKVLANILPPKREYIIRCPLTAIQKKFYRSALTGRLKRTIFKEYVKQFFTLNSEHLGSISNKSIRKFIEYKINGSDQTIFKDNQELLNNMELLYQKYVHKEITSKHLQNMLIQLRQIVDSTYLFFFPYLEPEELTLEKLLESSGKLQVLQTLALPLIDENHKIVIFSQFVNMLDLLEDWCELNDLKAFRIDGSVKNEDRKQQISAFNDPEDNHNVFLISTRAGGLGINLVAADTVILFDSDWNPQVDLQAMDRCHRIGQTKPVVIYRLCCDNTVEHVILTRAASKRRLEQMVIQMGGFNTLKKLALNEVSFIKQAGVQTTKSTNKELIQELSQLLMTNESSIGFELAKDNNKGSKSDEVLTAEELSELMDRDLSAYKNNRIVEMSHIKLFETTSGFEG